MAEIFFVYILTNAHRNVFYVGVTNDILRRVYEHKNKLIKGFSYKYNVDSLVYFEMFGSIELAILQEKRIKRWARPIKCDAIERMNPDWKDLYLELTALSKEEEARHPGLVPGSPLTGDTNATTGSGFPSWREIPGQARDDSSMMKYGENL
jgi:putative endonuclease